MNKNFWRISLHLEYLLLIIKDLERYGVMHTKIEEKNYEFENEYWRCSLEEIFDFCRGHQVFLYGAGKYGHFLKEQLTKHGIAIEAFVVTEFQNQQRRVCDSPVIELSTLKYESTSMRIVICTEKYVQEIENILIQKGIYEYKILYITYRKAKGIIKKDRNYHQKKEYLSSMEDGIIRIRITYKCPGKCDFCGQLAWSKEEQNLEMDPKWYFEYMTPLYPAIKAILITGGDSFFSENSYKYMKYLGEKFPHITIMTESNGITFNKKYQRLACDNLFTTHFSMNASNEETFIKGCWSSSGGRQAYQISINNLKSYIDLLESEEKICFAPNISMVINKNTADDVIPFLKFALDIKASYVIYYFDYRENNMEEDYFQDPETGRKALKQLMEI